MIKKDQEQKIASLAAYEVIAHRALPDVDSDSWLLRHKKTGARIALLPKDDSNKVFYIAFRTPPEDSTGVAHIIEHTVLCGSREFPVKDPFIELAKGSLNTFLNAMTYPDKTVYPVASCNDQDFKNLMHVYLDAVFYPNIYKEQNIFRQEGWHYETGDADSEITVNGVVYNEMKGALSSAEDILSRQINASLYPHTTYANESGGDPACIPDLTYEAYLDFHRRYYHPSNSYIYLYGDMDMAERLEWIDEHYLSHFDRLDIDSTIETEPAFAEPVEARCVYSILPEEDPKGKSFLSWNVAALPDGLDAGRNMALRILNYALCDAEGAPVRKALRDRGLGEDVYTIFENEIRQPSYSIISKYTDPERKEEFVTTIRDTLSDIASAGISSRALEAGINYYEFRYREADFGTYPKGLVYGLNALDSWLYDDEKPFIGHDPRVPSGQPALRDCRPGTRAGAVRKKGRGDARAPEGICRRAYTFAEAGDRGGARCPPDLAEEGGFGGGSAQDPHAAAGRPHAEGCPGLHRGAGDPRAGDHPAGDQKGGA